MASDNRGVRLPVSLRAQGQLDLELWCSRRAFFIASYLVAVRFGSPLMKKSGALLSDCFHKSVFPAPSNELTGSLVSPGWVLLQREVRYEVNNGQKTRKTGERSRKNQFTGPGFMEWKVVSESKYTK